MVAPEVAPNVSAREVDDVDMGDEVAQRGVSDTESVGCDELREPRRRNSPSDPTSREIEYHVLTGHATFRLWCAACVQGRGRAAWGRPHRAGRWFEGPSRIVGLLLHQVNFCSLDSRKRSRFPKLREGGEDDRKRCGHFGSPQSGVSMRQ